METTYGGLRSRKVSRPGIALIAPLPDMNEVTERDPDGTVLVFARMDIGDAGRARPGSILCEILTADAT